MIQGFEISQNETRVHLRAWGKTLRELFRNALRGVFTYLKPDIAARASKMKKEKQRIRADAVDINTLLIEFLSRAIEQADVRGIIFTYVTFTQFGENFLEAEMSGVPVEEFDREIKAVSYIDIDIKRDSKSGNYETTLLFEV
jgi:SHS2 domain-containing protein